MDPITLITGIAGTLVPLAELIGGKLLRLEGEKSRLLTWVLGVLMGAGAALLHLTSDNPVQGAIYGLLAALVANGLFSIDQVRKILEAIRLREPKAIVDGLTQSEAPKPQSVEDILRQRGR